MIIIIIFSQTTKVLDSFGAFSRKQFAKVLGEVRYKKVRATTSKAKAKAASGGSAETESVDPPTIAGWWGSSKSPDRFC